MLEHGRRLVERVSRERATVHFYSQVNYFPNICWPSKTSKTETQVAQILVEQPLLPLQDGGLSAAEEAGEEDCWISDHQFSGPILGLHERQLCFWPDCGRSFLAGNALVQVQTNRTDGTWHLEVDLQGVAWPSRQGVADVANLDLQRSHVTNLHPCFKLWSSNMMVKQTQIAQRIAAHFGFSVDSSFKNNFETRNRNLV